MIDWGHARTERLWLDRPVDEDVDDLHAIHTDQASWRHFPQGRHVERGATVEVVSMMRRRWRAHGLGCWSVRDHEHGPVIGWAGASVPYGCPWWNLAYRFATSVHGRGYAVETSRAAMQAAVDLDPERPVLAYLLEHNVASRTIAERLGLSLIWRGPDAGNTDPDAIRLVYLDRKPDDALLAALADHEMPVTRQGKR